MKPEKSENTAATPVVGGDRWFYLGPYLRTAHALPPGTARKDYTFGLAPLARDFVIKNWRNDCGNQACATLGGSCVLPTDWPYGLP